MNYFIVNNIKCILGNLQKIYVKNIKYDSYDSYKIYLENFNAILLKILKDIQVEIIDKKTINEQCKFKIYPNGDKVFFYFDKPLLFLKPIEIIENKKNGTIEIIQKYKKLNEQRIANII